MSSWASGAQIGPYVLISAIGSGGMGEVWKAQDTRLGRIVAIKRLKTYHSARFEQEARAIAALNHPNICQIYDIGADYLVLEYVDGERVRGPLPASEALPLAIQIAAALDEAHSRGILHRDLKPGNILLTTKGTPKLLDFGLAKLLVGSESDATKTMDGMAIGTAAYMSPEQAEGKALDSRSDIFSLGAVLYEMLSGHQAFQGSSTAQVLSAVLRDNPPLIQSGAEIQAVIRRCLAKNPVERFQTVRELRAALTALAAKAGSELPSIAVLPFANMSRDPDDEYFSDGLAEEIINALVRIPGLRVIARTSAFSFKGKNEDVRRTAEALGVANILEGSVRKAGNRIRVTAQLVTGSDGSHLWSERYDRELRDVFALQDEIAQSIADALQVKLGRAEPRQYTPNIEAHDLYLRARYQLDKISPESNHRGKTLLEQAMALDPRYALPHVLTGETYLTGAAMAQLPAHEAMPLARAAARKALDVDPSSPEANALLGMVAALYDYDWTEADRLFQHAMSADHVPPRVHHWYGYFYLLPLGRFEQCLHQQDLALRQDPLNVLFRFARIVSRMDMEEDTTHEALDLLELNEGLWAPHYLLALGYIIRGMWDEALPHIEKANSLTHWGTLVGLLAGVLVRTCNRTRAEDLVRGLDPKAYGTASVMAWFHAVTGEVDQTADWCEIAIQQRLPVVLHHLQSPISKDLRASARWPALTRMANLPVGSSQ